MRESRVSQVSLPRLPSGVLRLFPLLVLAASAGCTAIGAAVAKTSSVSVKPAYTGLAGQSVGVMAWADEGTRFDHDMLVLDITRGVANKFRGSQANKADELKGTTFPRDKNPDALYAYQQNHPGLEAEPIAAVAPRIGVTRLIYIEVGAFDLHPSQNLDLYRGTMTGTVQVVEVTGGKGKVAYTAPVQATFPEKGPEEGMPDTGDRATYLGTLDAFCTAVAQKFVTYEEAN